MSTLHIIPVLPDDAPSWQAVMDIYYAAFPEWEREPEEELIERINSGRYLMFAGVDQQDIIGFYILDINQQPNYALFCFLAVSESCRGKGFGKTLCLDAIQRFQQEQSLDWLLIEAEERQAIFYGKLGFKKIDFAYHVPKFDGPGSVPMSLMAICQARRSTTIRHDNLTQLVKHIYTSGYYLDENDARIDQQLAMIPQNADLIDWPPQ